VRRVWVSERGWLAQSVERLIAISMRVNTCDGIHRYQYLGGEKWGNCQTIQLLEMSMVARV
jgi:hypothetical protein